MFVRRLVERRPELVRRVRDELALGARRLLERREHGVEARGEPAELVVPPTSIRSERSPVSVTLSAVSVRRRTGASAARETTSPSAAASATPESATRSRSEPEPRERVVDLGERARDLDRVPGAVGEREHPHVRAVDASCPRRTACRRRCSAARSTTSVADRQLDVLERLAQRAPVGPDELDEGVRLAEPAAEPEERLAVGALDLGQRDLRDLRARAPRASRRSGRAAARGRRRTRARTRARPPARRLPQRRSRSAPGSSCRSHDSRSAYPTPRTVWISRGFPPTSVLRRR